jgi:hypothetical protein
MCTLDSEDQACDGMDSELFYSEEPADIELAKAVCARCPVRWRCLAAGLEGDEYGVWGGLSRTEREALRQPPRMLVALTTPRDRRRAAVVAA